MYQSRQIESEPAWSCPDGIKIHTISARHQPVDPEPYLPRLAEVKRRKAIAWADTPAFAIFHDGESYPYLVLGWWGNGNELFTSVSVLTDAGWVEDPARYSFCVYDLEIFWFEREQFVKYIDRAMPCLRSYREARPGDKT